MPAFLCFGLPSLCSPRGYQPWVLAGLGVHTARPSQVGPGPRGRKTDRNERRVAGSTAPWSSQLGADFAAGGHSTGLPAFPAAPRSLWDCALPSPALDEAWVPAPWTHVVAAGGRTAAEPGPITTSSPQGPWEVEPPGPGPPSSPPARSPCPLPPSLTTALHNCTRQPAGLA